MSPDLGLPADLTFEGEQLGRFVHRCRAEWPELEADQRDLLSAIGIEEDQALVAARTAAAAKPKKSQAERFQQGLETLAQYVGRVGHAKVPRAHKEALKLQDGSVEQHALGAWLNNVKARRAKLSTAQVAQLEALGVAW